MQMSD
jgi:hypothetical protein